MDRHGATSTQHDDPTARRRERDCALAAVERLKSRAGALLPILHAVQDALGYVPTATLPLIADGLNLTRAEVHGVASFYHDFRSTRGGRHVLRLCRAEACQALGARSLEAYARQRLGIDFHQTTEDGSISLEPVYCLGNCACGPSLMIDDELHGRVTPEGFDALVRDASAVS
ncbi:MAG: formate dehydrogenase subunit gamma [Rhodanobacteraceae bacterium]